MPILIYKKVGETPLEVLDRLRLEQPNLKEERLSYAGRLDPMAEGLLLVLVADECDEDKRKLFLSLDKEYEVEVLFGFSTDSYDLLGIPVKGKLVPDSDLKSLAEKSLTEFIGFNHGLKYPPFSSKTIDGKPLFQLARAGTNPSIKLPEIKGAIKSISIVESRQISSVELQSHVYAVVNQVKGDFRQKEIVEGWGSLLDGLPQDTFYPILKLHVACQSGVYMRSLAESLGNRLGSSGLAHSIKRTKIGKYRLEDLSVDSK